MRLFVSSGADSWSHVGGLPTDEARRVVAGTKNAIFAAATCLMSCKDHDGVHHFAHLHEGRALICSESAVQCLNAAGFDTS